MSVETLQPTGVAAPLGHLSNAARAGRHIYVAGLVALDEGGALVGAGSMRDQTLHICRTIQDICRQQGAELTAVARCLVFITDRARYAEFDTAFAEVFGEHRPARATMIADLVNPEFLVEIISDIELPAER